MTVKFYAYIRDKDYAGCTEAAFSGASTLRELGEQMSGRYGESFRGEFFSPDGSELGRNVIVIVNGRRSDFTGGLDTPLRDTDTVLVFPVVAGG
ncbi:MAG: MoaD family protein [Oscillospiraceae bacterium]